MNFVYVAIPLVLFAVIYLMLRRMKNTVIRPSKESNSYKCAVMRYKDFVKLFSVAPSKWSFSRGNYLAYTGVDWGESKIYITCGLYDGIMIVLFIKRWKRAERKADNAAEAIKTRDSQEKNTSTIVEYVQKDVNRMIEKSNEEIAKARELVSNINIQ